MYHGCKNDAGLSALPGKVITDPKRVKIYAYDRFLNCSVIHMDGSPMEYETTLISDDLRVYPNSFCEDITLEFGKSLQDISQLIIYDLQGRVVKTIKVNSSDMIKIELHELGKGSYILMVKNKTAIWTVKIIKE